MRVVFDTNIYISAFAIPGGKAEEAYRLALHGHFSLLSSITILAETTRILQTKFYWARTETERLATHLSQVSELIPTHPHVQVLTDEPDNRILECGIEGHADYVVTGDRRLLELREYEGLQIIALSKFLPFFTA